MSAPFNAYFVQEGLQKGADVQWESTNLFQVWAHNSSSESLVCRIRIWSDPELFAGSVPVIWVLDPDPCLTPHQKSKEINYFCHEKLARKGDLSPLFLPSCLQHCGSSEKNELMIEWQNVWQFALQKGCTFFHSPLFRKSRILHLNSFCIKGGSFGN